MNEEKTPKPTSDSEGGVEKLVRLRCENCEKDYETPAIPQEWRDKIRHYRMKYKFCPECLHKKIEESLKHLPEIIKALAAST